MSTFGFHVNLDPTEAGELDGQGYSLAIFKRNTGNNGPTVQWVSEPIFAENISVRWTNRYQGFFTTTNLNNGATIVQTSSAPVQLGQAYSYQTGSWKSEPDSVNPGSLLIKNNLSRASNFGIAQLYTNYAGKDVYSPLAVQPDVQPNGGSVEFSPKEDITVCFTLTKLSGTITNVATSKWDTTLSAGTFPTLKYRSGKWSEELSARASVNDFSSLASHSNDGLWQYRFDFPLPVYPARLIQTIERYLPKYLVTSSSSNPSTSIEVTLYGLPDPTAEVTGLKGKLVTDLTSTLVVPGFWEVRGQEALIHYVTPVVSPLSIIWNSLHKK